MQNYITEKQTIPITPEWALKLYFHGLEISNFVPDTASVNWFWDQQIEFRGEIATHFKGYVK